VKANNAHNDDNHLSNATLIIRLLTSPSDMAVKYFHQRVFI